MGVHVQSEPFDLGTESTAFAASLSASGAMVTFTGLVRDVPGGLSVMEIEHYPGMTERALEKIRQDALKRFSLEAALVIHRYGALKPGDLIMMVATAARHRADAFAGAEFLMDYLKSRAPFWKKEQGQDVSTWVAARDKDEDALKRW